MKRLTSLALASTVVLGISAFSYAEYGQPGKTPFVDRMVEELNLDQNQQAQVQQIFAEEREQHQVIREESRNKLAAVLTPEQLEQLESRRPGGGHKGKRGDCPEMQPPAE